MRILVLLFGLVVTVTLSTSCDIFSEDYISSPVSSGEQGTQKACALNELKYLSPPMGYTLYSFEYQSSGDQESLLAMPYSVTIPEDVILLVGFWRNDFADSRTAERDYVQYGHVVKSSVMYHVIEPKTDSARLVHKGSREEFFENNPGMQSHRCGERIDLSSQGKTYIADFCIDWDYCSPPKTAFLNNMIVTTADGKESFIALSME